MKNRKTYGRWDIGRIEVEAGWFPGEDIGISVSILTFRRGHINLLYFQVAKFCFSLGVDTGPTPEAVAEWGNGFEALAHHEPKPVVAELPPAPEEDPKPSAEEIEAARIIAKNGYCGLDNPSCEDCPAYNEEICLADGKVIEEGHKPAAWFRAWLEERGIPVEESATPEAAE